ncbi:MAG TPA: cyclic nucleotide-binding domain-containing protein [Chloroflexia bacterium]|nr:cyclic nucleotide-binding domain-containing protein [Chloroflexia bacterium]
MDTFEDIVREQPLLKGLTPVQLEEIADCASFVRYEKGEFLFREGEFARRFYIITSGKIAIEIFTPGRGPVIVETLDEGDLLGWSWLFEPYRWHFDAMAQTEVKAVAFDALCMRGKCDKDHSLGYELVKRFSQIIMERLQATRMALLDVYGAVPDETVAAAEVLITTAKDSPNGKTSGEQ